MKIAVIGASGLLGEGHLHILSNTQHEYLATHFNKKLYPQTIPLDIRDTNKVTDFVSNSEPDVVINTAAITNPETCERDPNNAYATNVIGTQNLADACNRSGVHFILVSTEYVFDGNNGPYKETDTPSPISFYGKTKFEAEQRTLKINSKFCVARTAMLYGWSKTKSNLALQLISNLRNGKRMEVITDQTVSPSYNDNVAEMLIDIAEKKLSGIYHISGASVLTRYEFALSIARVFGLDRSLIGQISISQFGWKAKRPINGGLIIDKAKIILTKKSLTNDEALIRMKNDERN